MSSAQALLPVIKMSGASTVHQHISNSKVSRWRYSETILPSVATYLISTISRLRYCCKSSFEREWQPQWDFTTQCYWIFHLSFETLGPTLCVQTLGSLLVGSRPWEGPVGLGSGCYVINCFLQQRQLGLLGGKPSTSLLAANIPRITVMLCSAIQRRHRLFITNAGTGYKLANL